MSKVATDSIWFEEVHAQIPRLLGQLNRNPLSEAYGSFDRAYWHYRTSDFSCGRFQEALYTLALLYKHNWEGNNFYRDPEVLEWINAAITFTRKIQQRNGSFDEWYPNESSYVCTAFVTVAVAKTTQLLDAKELVALDDAKQIVRRGADWLSKHSEGRALNQLAGGVCALQRAATLIEDEGLAVSAKENLEVLLDSQHSEGWWPEYGGPDVGYLSLLIDYLSQYREMTNDKRVAQALNRANSFLASVLHPDLSAGGTYYSRNTEYVIPSGVARCAAQGDSAAVQIYAHIREALVLGRGVCPSGLDDRYLCYILYNWIEAGLIAPCLPDSLPSQKGVTYDESGIRIIRTDKYSLFLNCYKGGSFHLYTTDGYYIDSGVALVSGARRLSSGVLDYKNIFEISQGGVEVRGVAKAVSDSLMSPMLLVGFRLFQRTIGRFDFVGSFVKNVLRNRLITSKSPAGVQFSRHITYNDDHIVIVDVVRGGAKGCDVRVGGNASYNFIPSSRYYSVHGGQLFLPNIEKKETPEGDVVITRTFTLNAS